MEESTFRAVRLCQVLGSHTRFRILLLLAKRRMTPGELRRALKKSPSLISRHLEKLRSADLVRFKREKTGLLYWLKRQKLPALLSGIEEFAKSLG